MIFCFPLTGYKHRNLNIIIKASHWQDYEEGHEHSSGFSVPFMPPVASHSGCPIVTLFVSLGEKLTNSLIFRNDVVEGNSCSETFTFYPKAQRTVSPRMSQERYFVRVMGLISVLTLGILPFISQVTLGHIM